MKFNVVRSGLGVVFALQLCQPCFADEAKTAPRLAEEPLTQNSRLVRTHISDLFRIVLASYSQELRDLRSKKNPTKVELDMLARRQSELKKLLTIYDQAIKISPVVFAVSLQLGAELPSRLLSALPVLNRLKFGEVGVQYSFGVTLAMTRNEATGRPEFGVGLTQIAGSNLTVGKKTVHDQLRPKAGITWLLPAVAIIVPLMEEIPSVALGDLQGVYWGGAGEISTPAGEGVGVARTFSLGAYAKFKPSFEIPDAGLIYMFHGKGGEVNPPSGQGEALWLSTVVASDESSFRSPIPYFFNNRTSKHSVSSRRAASTAIRDEVEQMSGDEVLEQVRKVQQDLHRR